MPFTRGRRRSSERGGGLRVKYLRRPTYLLDKVHPRLHYAPNKKPGEHYVRALTSSIVILDNAFSRRLVVLATKRVVPPVLEFFRSFFAEEERARERVRERRRVGTGEEVVGTKKEARER